MDSPLLAVNGINNLWFAVPLVIVISLVYAATRHERAAPILSHSVRTGAWIVSFMLAIGVVLAVVGWLAS